MASRQALRTMLGRVARAVFSGLFGRVAWDPPPWLDGRGLIGAERDVAVELGP